MGVFRRYEADDEGDRGDLLPASEAVGLSPIAPLAARCRRYVPEPEVEKEMELRNTGLRRIVPPHQAPDPRGFPTTPRGTGVRRIGRRRPCAPSAAESLRIATSNGFRRCQTTRRRSPPRSATDDAQLRQIQALQLDCWGPHQPS